VFEDGNLDCLEARWTMTVSNGLLYIRHLNLPPIEQPTYHIKTDPIDDLTYRLQYVRPTCHVDIDIRQQVWSDGGWKSLLVMEERRPSLSEEDRLQAARRRLGDLALAPKQAKPLTQADVDKFADATGDHEWIHVDVPRATKAFGAPVVHGYLILALLPMLSQSMIETGSMRNGLNYGLDRLRFTNIVHVGQRVRLRQKMIDVAPKRGGLLVVKEVIIEIENEDRPALVAEALFLLFPQAAEEAVDRI